MPDTTGDSNASTGRTAPRTIRRKKPAGLTATSGSVPEMTLVPHHPMSEKARVRLANILAKKNGTTWEDELGAINQEQARREAESFIAQSGEHQGKMVIRKPVKQGVKKSMHKKRKPSAKSERQKEIEKQRRIVAEQALELRKAGVAYQKIADSLGYGSAGAAKNAIDGYLRKVEFEAAKDVVLMDLQRLDEYQMRCTERLRNNGDLGQIDRLMRIMELRYRILGVNEETTAELQQHFGIRVQNAGVMVIQGSESDFVSTMMRAVGVDPNSPEGRQYIDSATNRAIEPAPMRGKDEVVYDDSRKLSDAEIIDADVVEALDTTAYDTHKLGLDIDV